VKTVDSERPEQETIKRNLEKQRKKAKRIEKILAKCHQPKMCDQILLENENRTKNYEGEECEVWRMIMI